MSIQGDDTGSGFGVKGTSATSSGVVGEGPAWAGVVATSVTGSGVSAFSDSGPGVLSLSNSGIGVSGESLAASGVAGKSETGTGVAGTSRDGLGVSAESQHDNGVLGTAAAAGKAGVFGRSVAVQGGNGVVGLSEGLSGIGVFGSAERRGTGVVGVGATGILGRGDVGPGLDAASKQDHGVQGQAESPVHAGVLGRHAQAGPGVAGESAFGNGVEGTGIIGVLGTAAPGSNRGVVGRVGAGPWPMENGAVLGQSSLMGAAGVQGIAMAGGTTGVVGVATAPAGIGVSGKGHSIGVSGEAVLTGPIAAGVLGTGSGLSGNGVMGVGGGKGSGVIGLTSNGVGVTGMNDGSGGHGIFGYSVHPTNVGAYSYAGVFHGAVGVTGPVYKSGGGFRIDHPDQPATHYLQHWFVESDEMRNLYDGIVELDGDGAADIAVPSWFETLNEGFRYQLTPLGGPAPDLHVARELGKGSFGIGGGRAGQRVSWQVTGVRRDPWALAHRCPADLPKPPHEREFYRHPELYGLPPDRGVDYDLTEWARAARAARAEGDGSPDHGDFQQEVQG